MRTSFTHVSITNNSNGLHDVTTATPCPCPQT